MVFDPGRIVGHRYPPVTQLKIDTENFSLPDASH